MTEWAVGADPPVMTYIHSSDSSEKPITNLGDVSLGLNTVFTGTVSGTDEQEHTVNVRLPFSLADVSEDTNAYMLTTQEYNNFTNQLDNFYSTFNNQYQELSNKFERLLNYLENWIDVGNITMAGLNDYVEYGDYTVRLVITKPMTEVGETFKIYIFNIPDGYELTKITEFKNSTTTEFATFTTENRIITITPTRIPTGNIVMTFASETENDAFDISFSYSRLSTEGNVIKTNDITYYQNTSE